MKFGEALEEAKKGALIARAGWNGKGMFVFQRPEDWLSTDMIVNKGEKYGGYIYATTFSEAEDFVRQRKATEKVVGGPCLEQEEINRLYNHSS